MSAHDERAARAQRALEMIGERYPGLTLRQFGDMLNDPERRDEASPILCLLSEALGPAAHDAGAVLSELLAMVGQVTESTVQLRIEIRAIAATLAGASGLTRRLPLIADTVFEPYRRQLEAPSCEGMPLPGPPERLELVLLAVALQSPEETEAGVLPPLEHVALAAGRHDILAAVLYARYPELAKDLAAVRPDPQHDREQVRLEAIADVYRFVGGDFARRAWNGLQGLGMRDARCRLHGVLSRAYVFASLRNERREATAREDQRERRMARGADTDALAATSETAESQLTRIALEDAIAAYLNRSTNRDLDARVIAALRVGASMEALARETGVSASTLKYRRDKVVERLRRHLLEESQS